MLILIALARIRTEEIYLLLLCFKNYHNLKGHLTCQVRTFFLLTELIMVVHYFTVLLSLLIIFK